jgi:hypothetical protein
MHYTEGPDFEDLGGGVRRHKATPPETIISKNIMNATMMEIINTVLASGQALELTGAADQTAGWIQLREAVKRLAGRGGQDASVFSLPSILRGIDVGVFAVKTITADPFTITDLRGLTVIDQSGGPFADGLVLLEESAEYEGRTIYVMNGTGARIKVRSVTSTLTPILLEDQSATTFVNVNGFWYPTSNSATSGSFTAVLAEYGADVAVAAGTAKWEKRGNFVDLTLPNFAGTLLVTGLVRIVDTGFAELPVAMAPSSIQNFPMNARDGADPTIVVKPFHFENSPRRIVSSISFVAGSISGYRTTIRYFTGTGV